MSLLIVITQSIESLRVLIKLLLCIAATSLPGTIGYVRVSRSNGEDHEVELILRSETRTLPVGIFLIGKRVENGLTSFQALGEGRVIIEELLGRLEADATHVTRIGAIDDYELLTFDEPVGSNGVFGAHGDGELSDIRSIQEVLTLTEPMLDITTRVREPPSSAYHVRWCKTSNQLTLIQDIGICIARIQQVFTDIEPVGRALECDLSLVGRREIVDTEDDADRRTLNLLGIFRRRVTILPISIKRLRVFSKPQPPISAHRLREDVVEARTDEIALHRETYRSPFRDTELLSASIVLEGDTCGLHQDKVIGERLRLTSLVGNELRTLIREVLVVIILTDEDRQFGVLSLTINDTLEHAIA